MFQSHILNDPPDFKKAGLLSVIYRTGLLTYNAIFFEMLY